MIAGAAITLAALALLAAGGSASEQKPERRPSSGRPEPAPAPAPTPGPDGFVVTTTYAQLDALLIRAGLTKRWRQFCLLTAAGESNFVSNVYLGPPDRQPPGTKLSSSWERIGQSEYEATRTAYNRNAELWQSCPWGASRYTTAGGLFGLLAPNAIYGYRSTDLRCLDPWKIYDAAEVIPMFLAYCKRTMGNSRMDINGDWLDLRLGVGATKRIGVPEQRTSMIAKLEKKGGALKRVGLDRTFLFGKVEPLPNFNILTYRELLVP